MEERAKPAGAPGLRLFEEKDLPFLYEIYSWYDTNTPWNLDWIPESPQAFASRIQTIAQDFPVYIALDGQGTLIGYGYAHKAMEKQAYEHVAELTVYFRQGPHYGLATAMLEKLEEDLKRQHIRWMISCITEANTASTAFHDRHGFTLLGRLPRAGYKNQIWYDVVWYGKELDSDVTRADGMSVPRWCSFPDLKDKTEN